MGFFLWLTVCSFLAVPSLAFLLARHGQAATMIRRPPPPSSLVLLFEKSLICKESDEELIHDIEVMEDEAKNRLHSLLEQMEDLQAFQATTSSSNSQTKHDVIEHVDIHSQTRTEHDKAKTANGQQSVGALTPGNVFEDSHQGKKTTRTNQQIGEKKATSIATQQQEPRKEVDIIRSRPLDLLADTSWKIVLNIGREEGTWMPSHWGKSGSRLRIEVHGTFTSEEAERTKDPFFAHSTQPVRVFAIEEAFAWPTMVGVGRKTLQMDPKAGRYQICPGAGPAGTDLLRLMIPIPEDLKKDDVTLNAGRVYGTTGYFGYPDEGRQKIISAVQEDYNHSLANCAKLQGELSKCDNFLSWCSARHAVWNAERELDHAMERLRMAGQHYPDHAHMRMDPSGRVGLAKEGGLCVQVHTGLAMEYHILGRMEVGHLKR